MILQIAISQVLASLAMISAGTNYVFSLYGPQLSQILSFNQSQTSLIAMSGNFGVFLMGPVFGGIFNYSCHGSFI